MPVLSYRKKSTSRIQAIQWDGGNYDEVKAFAEKGRHVNPIKCEHGNASSVVVIHCGSADSYTLTIGFWVAKDSRGQLIVCDPKTFESVYEPND
jgi:hypothetical protein